VSLVILAAGLGSRFGGHKQLATLETSGKPLMFYSVMDAYRAGLRQLVLVIRAEMEPTFRKQFLPLLPADLEISLVHQRIDDLPAGCRASWRREKPWGTGHALWCARNAVSNACIVINADDYYGPGSFPRLLDHFSQQAGWALVSYRLGDTLSGYGAVNRGLCKVRDGFLLRIMECKSIERLGGAIYGELDIGPVTLQPDDPVSMNIWGFEPDVFACLESGLAAFMTTMRDREIAEFYLPAQVMASIEAGAGSVRVYESRDTWKGITYREDLQRLDPFFAQE
jgi:NDP-sugar pyrophosphorylase family protein